MEPSFVKNSSLVWKGINAFALLVAVLFLTGCNKALEVEELPGVTIRVTAVTAEPMSFQVYLNGSIERLLTPSANTFSVPITLSVNETSVPVRILQLPAQITVADTGYRLMLGAKQTHSLTIFQARAGDLPFLVLPDSVISPPAGHARMQFTYSEATWPDAIKLRLFKSSSLTASDSCYAEKYRFSNWGTILEDRSDLIYYDILDASTREVLVSRRMIPITYGTFSEDCNIYQLNKSGTEASFLRLY